jgi:hypothetical protein
MQRRSPVHAACLAVLALAAASARGQTPEDEQKALERKIEALEKQQAEMRRQLEELKKELAARAATPTPTPTPPPAPAQATGPVTSPGLTPFPVASWGETGQVTSGTTFNPAISVIAEGLYYADNARGEGLHLFPQSDNFFGPGTGGFRDLSPGFNLGETEFTFSAAVDPYFDAMAILTVTTEEVGMEEAWIRTRKLLPGLSIKAGKFFSDIGYINKQHPHQWDFVDQNLPYAMFFDGQIDEVGVQVEYLPKTPVYMLVGGEALQGNNPGIANYLGPSANPDLSSTAGPRLFTGFFKISPDIGYSDALQLGASGGYDTMYQEAEGDVASQGTSWFTGFDAVFKHDDPRPFGQGDLTLQGEFLYRARNQTDVTPDAPLAGVPRRLRQTGFYAQAVYGFLPRLQAALRYDQAGGVNHLTVGGVETAFGTVQRFAAALTVNPTEFSRFRAQFERSEVPLLGRKQTVNQFFLQFQVSLGVHGAHKF